MMEIFGPIVNRATSARQMPAAASTVMASPSTSISSQAQCRTDFLCQLVDDGGVTTDTFSCQPPALTIADHVGLISSVQQPGSRLKCRGPSNVLAIPLALVAPTIKSSRSHAGMQRRPATRSAVRSRLDCERRALPLPSLRFSARVLMPVVTLADSVWSGPIGGLRQVMSRSSLSPGQQPPLARAEDLATTRGWLRFDDSAGCYRARRLRPARAECLTRSRSLPRLAARGLWGAR